ILIEDNHFILMMISHNLMKAIMRYNHNLMKAIKKIKIKSFKEGKIIRITNILFRTDHREWFRVICDGRGDLKKNWILNNGTLKIVH
ncbi:MAG: hypothetical protein ACK55Z_07840, partial [bacterium]